VKVLIVTPEFPPHALGGGGRMVRVLAQALGKSGCQVTVLSGLYKVKGFSDSPFSTNSGQVEVIWLPLLPTPKVKFQLNTIMPPNIRSSAEFLRIFLRGEFDVVHIHGYGHFFGDLAAILSRLVRKPYIYTIHGFPKEPKRRGGILKTVYDIYSLFMGNPLIHGAAKIIAVSESLAKECVSFVSENKIEVIYNALDSQSYQKPSDATTIEIAERYKLQGKKVILGIGRLSEAKGFQYAIQAFPEVLKKIPEAQLVIVGKDDGYGYFHKLEQMASKNGVSLKVTFVGGVNDEEKNALLWQAEIVVIPSIEEVFGLVALEAMASGRPIVASNIGGLVEILAKDKYSFLVESANVAQLAEALVNMLEDKNLLREARANNVLRSSEFDVKHMANMHIELYAKLTR
jgi:glycosyltransferase involved in cell wall biosynthesis